MKYQLEMFSDVKGPVIYTTLATVPKPQPKPDDDDFTDVGGEG